MDFASMSHSEITSDEARKNRKLNSRRIKSRLGQIHRPHRSNVKRYDDVDKEYNEIVEELESRKKETPEEAYDRAMSIL